MTVFQIFRVDISTSLPLIFADVGIMAGFPSPAQDYITASIDLNTELISNPASTFYANVGGDSVCDEDINEGDIFIIDRSIEPAHVASFVCCLDGEFTKKRL